MDSPEIRLTALPTAVIIRVHKCEPMFLPCGPCESCATFNPLSDKCADKRDDLKGVFAVEPITRAWKYAGPELQGQFIAVNFHLHQAKYCRPIQCRE